MIALKPFSRKVGGAMAKVLEGKEIPKIILDSYSKDEIQELKDKKIIGETQKAEPAKKSYKDNK